MCECVCSLILVNLYMKDKIYSLQSVFLPFLFFGCRSQVKNSTFTVFISDFTENTYIMVVTTSPQVEKATTELNIKAARKHFERLLRKPADLGHHELSHQHHQPGQVA